VPLAYREQGSGSPVVLLHGMGASSSAWHLVMPRLARHCRVLALDLPGHGQSPPPPNTNLHGAWFRKAVCRFVEETAGDGVALIGHSLSGGLALLAAMEAPYLFSSLTAVSPAGLGPELALGLRLQCLPAVGQGMALLAPALFRALGRDRVERLLLRRFAPNGEGAAVLPLLREALTTYASREAVRGYFRLLREVATIRGQRARYQVAHRLHELRLPTLVVWGALDRVLPVAHAHRAQAACPHLDVRVLPGCGHSPHLECPDLLLTVLEHFLPRHRPPFLTVPAAAS
jgi:pimeloyl-ACP methyl ester carboxylesterase